MFANVFAKRRHELALRLGEGTVALIPGNTPQTRSRDTHYPFRQESNFFYLTGWTEPNAVLLIRGGPNHHSILYCQKKSRPTDIWIEKTNGPAYAKSVCGFDDAYGFANTKELYAHVKKALREATAVVYPKMIPLWFSQFVTILEHNHGVCDTDYVIGEMRLIKDSYEIDIMRRAAQISGRAHRDILKQLRSGMFENDIEAIISCSFRRAGGDPLHAYPSIVACGKNAGILHYTRNNAPIVSGELLLIDAGCELEGYASDITRTFPVSGYWSKPQRALYEIVLHAQMEAISNARVGVSIGSLHNIARRCIIDGLLSLELIKANDTEDAFARRLDSEFFPHGTSHWLGLDVHDVGDYKRDSITGAPHRLLEEGMVITVEPGIYTCNTKAPKPYRNIGIRIEDDVLITNSGPVVLSEYAPKDPDKIEAMMSDDTFKI